ncbi:Fpg/Nei family DNA glycosylase [Nocardioides sp. SYSU DS0651]|uniref:Fpg/Nei family DNA glycosylase n=1 Tax=Nocardioides sp. SYSU DS0651 TaxID=3415955 RepID=UPI003F4B9C98
MPEGHTIHRLARDLAELRGTALRVSSPQGRFALQAATVDGAVLDRTDAYGKHLLLMTDGAGTIHVHLGMRGIFLRYDDPAARPRKQVRLRLATDVVAWDLIAPSTCELLDDDGVRRVVAGLGPDPLRADADVAAALAALSADRRPIGAALLDQGVLAGVGNVFRNEALHAVGIHPARSSRSLSPVELDTLWDMLVAMMSRAVEDGRIVTVDVPDRLAVPEAGARRVYQQQRCRDCGAAVVVGTVGGRTSYHCPVEQPA